MNATSDIATPGTASRMLDRIIAYLEARVERNAFNPHPFDRRHVAVAALLVEASRLDGRYDPTEQGTIVRLVKETLNLPAIEARALLEVAQRREAHTGHDWIFCSAINKGYDLDERIAIMRKLWELALSDGNLHTLEAMMLERVAGQLEIPEADIRRIREAMTPR
jgi:uncharacterized tellurite resistance protein B-like protein